VVREAPLPVWTFSALLSAAVGKPLMTHLVKTGQIRAVKLGKRVVVSVQSLRELVDGKKEPCDSPENTAELQGKTK